MSKRPTLRSDRICELLGDVERMLRSAYHQARRDAPRINVAVPDASSVDEWVKNVLYDRCLHLSTEGKSADFGKDWDSILEVIEVDPRGFAKEVRAAGRRGATPRACEEALSLIRFAESVDDEGGVLVRRLLSELPGSDKQSRQQWWGTTPTPRTLKLVSPLRKVLSRLADGIDCPVLVDQYAQLDYDEDEEPSDILVRWAIADDLILIAAKLASATQLTLADLAELFLPLVAVVRPTWSFSQLSQFAQTIQNRFDGAADSGLVTADALLMAFVSDRWTRKETESALLRLQSWFRDLLDTIAVGIRDDAALQGLRWVAARQCGVEDFSRRYWTVMHQFVAVKEKVEHVRAVFGESGRQDTLPLNQVVARDVEILLRALRQHDIESRQIEEVGLECLRFWWPERYMNVDRVGLWREVSRASTADVGRHSWPALSWEGYNEHLGVTVQDACNESLKMAARLLWDLRSRERTDVMAGLEMILASLAPNVIDDCGTFDPSGGGLSHTRVNSQAGDIAASSSPPWVVHLLDSPEFNRRRVALARLVLSNERISRILTLLAERGGRMTIDSIGHGLGIALVRAAGVVEAMRALLNIEGVQVLAVDEAKETVELNLPLLLSQFSISAGR